METESLKPSESDTFDEQIAKRIVRAISEAKSERKMLTAELARRYNAVRGDDRLKPTTLNNLLAGKRKSISVGELIAFSAALDLDPLDLVPELNTRDDAALRDKYRKELIADLLRLP